MGESSHIVDIPVGVSSQDSELKAKFGANSEGKYGSMTIPIAEEPYVT